MYISTHQALLDFCHRAREFDAIAVDTEFLRERTFHPRLCLVQIATPAESVAVDPLVIDDLSPLAELMGDESVTKVFHACSQDMEVMLHTVGVLPRPIFDTQVAAAFLGERQQISYGALVQTFCGVSLPKTESLTDWSRRPLTESQLDYAADDVIYLPRMYRHMKEQLESQGRLHWLDPEFAEMRDPARFDSDERERYRRLKRVGQLSRRQLAAAREVAAWREITAQKRNVPRKWVITDEQIVEACKREARTIDDLFMVRGMREKLNTRDARTVASLMKAAMDASPNTWPEPDRGGKNEPNVDAPLDLMSALVRLRAKENGVAFPTLASHDDLVRVARGYRQGIDLLRGWRRALVGEELIELLEGKLMLSLEGHELKVTRLDGEE